MIDHQVRGPTGRLKAVTLVVLAVVVLAIGWGAYGRYQQNSDAAATLSASETFVPTVRTVRAEASGPFAKLDLPGATEAFDLAAVNARATGYIAERHVDIGSVVKAGELLAVIAAPDLDHQLSQARAQLGQAEAALNQANANVKTASANYDLARVTNDRFAQLARDGWATHQEADNSRLTMVARNADLTNSQAGVTVAEANVAAARANVDRLVQLTAYERVVAPFDGIITRRNVDVGDLVTADSTGSNGQFTMFTLAHSNQLRVRVDIPQSEATGVQEGLEAEVKVPEMPGRVFNGRVARNSVALAAGSRTLLAEVDVDNQDNLLRPGLYVTVSIDVPRTMRTVTIPAEALIFNAAGTQVAVVDNDRIQLRKVQIWRDRGATLDLSSGLSGGETVVVNPFANLADNQKVKVQDDGRQLAGAPQPPRTE